ncbi:MAG: hypothetical protein JWP27_1413 [Flaviaesturariibacter sp.]|nr:hypothetical protein [Flaviaesturariibacter sp.]
MRRYLPYIIALFVLILIGVIAVLGYRAPKRLDERVTLRSRDKIPYGTFAARNLLPSLFPGATVVTDNAAPGEWDAIEPGNADQAVVIVAPSFLATEDELNTLAAFVEKGNYVLVITGRLNNRTETFFGLKPYRVDVQAWRDTNAVEVKLASPRFAPQTFAYPGAEVGRIFPDIDPARIIVLGTDRDGEANFIQMNSGNGAVFLHGAPLALSNYFILHRNNIGYYQQVFSVLPKTVKKIVWNEFYTARNHEGNDTPKEPNWLKVLFRYPAFKWALLTAVGVILLFLLSEMRRRQRFIPDMEKPRNESLDFVQTVGRLYYDKRDHMDLARKMAQYFLDHVRQQYKIPTNELSADFVQALQAKSGYSLAGLNEIVGFIQFLYDAPGITEGQLSHFHKQLETFYQTT